MSYTPLAKSSILKIRFAATTAAMHRWLSSTSRAKHVIRGESSSSISVTQKQLDFYFTTLGNDSNLFVVTTIHEEG